MKPSGYLAKRNKIEKKEIEEAENMMMQFLFDTCLITMHEDFGWGYQRLKQFESKWSETVMTYLPALRSDMEADVYQERFDRATKAFIPDGEEFHPFADRYPYVKRLGYEPRRRK